MFEIFFVKNLTMTIYKKYDKNIIKLTSICALFCIYLCTSAQIVFADSKRMRCNMNSDCRPGFVCIGGMGKYEDTDSKLGCCEVITPLRQLCIFHNLLTGTFGKGIFALVVISTGLSAIFGKLRPAHLITLGVGLLCLFCSYGVVGLLTGYKYQVCELVDTSVEPGRCADSYDEENIYNAVGE